APGAPTPASRGAAESNSSHAQGGRQLSTHREYAERRACADRPRGSSLVPSHDPEATTRGLMLKLVPALVSTSYPVSRLRTRYAAARSPDGSGHTAPRRRIAPAAGSSDVGRPPARSRTARTAESSACFRHGCVPEPGSHRGRTPPG